MLVTDIPIDFGETFVDNREQQIADPAGLQNHDSSNFITSPEIMTSLQMFQQQRYSLFTGVARQFL